MSKLQEKLDQASGTKKQTSTITIKYGDKTVFNMEMDLPPYSEEVFNDSSMFYFFKDFRNALDKKIAEEHKKIAFSKMERDGNANT